MHRSRTQFVFWAAALVSGSLDFAGALRRSEGCAKPSDFAKNSPTLYDIEIDDPNFGRTPSREFVVELPGGFGDNYPLPLLLYYHGQSGNAISTANSLKFGELGKEKGFMTVYPQGLSDQSGFSTCGTGWNTGANGDERTCTSDASPWSCCFESCRDLGLCSKGYGLNKCSWSTCYDDVFFTEKLIDFVGKSACIDLDAVFISGASNGGMVSFNIADKIPAKIAAVVPIFGLPLRGHLGKPSSLPFLFLSGRSDEIVPPGGGLSSQGWYYVGAEEAAAAYGAANRCSSRVRSISTPFDGGDSNLACTEHPDCSNNALTMTCFYDGGHNFPRGDVIEQITVWFISKYFDSSETAEDATVVRAES